jgi:hypothetical protein
MSKALTAALDAREVIFERAVAQVWKGRYPRHALLQVTIQPSALSSQ